MSRQHATMAQHLLDGDTCMHRCWSQETLSTPLSQSKQAVKKTMY